MAEPRICYKAVSVAEHDLQSFVLAGALKLTYTPSVWLEAKVGPIMAFSTEDHAGLFIIGSSFRQGGDTRTQIWKAEYTPYEIEVPYIMSHLYSRKEESIREFWERLEADPNAPRTIGTRTCPHGTVFCRTIKLIEQVH